MKYAVCVTFRINAGYWHDVLPLMYANAKESLEKEKGCLQFEVCTNPGQVTEIFLFEIYESEEAFQEHLSSEHFLEFDAKTAHMVEEKTIKTYSTVA